MSVQFTPDQITELATGVRRGMEVFVHRHNGRMLIADDPERNPQADPEAYEIIMQTVATDQESFFQIDKLSAQDAIAIMKAFTDRIRDQALWQNLTYALKRPRPFKTFKEELKKYPKAYEKWREFRQKRYEKYVGERLEVMAADEATTD